jgi:hypothetical protein
MFVTPMNISYAENTTQYQLNILFGDIVNTDLSNEVDVVSDMSLEARNLLSQIWRGSLFNDVADVQLPTSATPFLERFNDHIGGVSLDLIITVMEDMNACPMYDLPAPTETPICETPTPTPTETSTQSITPTPTETPNETPTETPTNTPTETPTNTPTETPTNTPTITPTDNRSCRTYQLLTPNITTFVYTDCSGFTQSVQVFWPNNLIICAKEGSVSISVGSGTITDIGTCPLPTPTPTTTETPTTTPTPTITPV